MASSITQLSTNDLHKRLREKREALRQFRFSIAGGTARNVKEGRNLRREIARILTELRAREQHEAARADTAA